MRALLAMLAVCGAAQAAVPPDGIELTILRQDAGNAQESVQRFQLDTPKVRALLASLEPVPVQGLRGCAGAAPGYLSVRLSVRVAGHAVLRLRSDSLCADLQPWNLTDGARLSTLADPRAGAALSALVRAQCTACLPPLDGTVPGQADGAPDASFDGHYAALLAAWRRLDGKGATAIKIETLPLTEALDWMDHARFVRELERSARTGRRSIAPLARDMLRTLSITHTPAED